MEDPLGGDGWFSSSVKKSCAAVAHSLLTSTASADQDSSAQAPRSCDLFSSINFSSMAATSSCPGTKGSFDVIRKSEEKWPSAESKNIVMLNCDQ